MFFFLPLFRWVFLFPLCCVALNRNYAPKKKWYLFIMKIVKNISRKKIRILYHLDCHKCKKYKHDWIDLNWRADNSKIEYDEIFETIVGWLFFTMSKQYRHIKSIVFFSVKSSHTKYIRLSARIHCLSRIFFFFASFVHSSNFKCYPILFVNEVSQFYGATIVTFVRNVMCHIYTCTHKITFGWISGICTYIVYVKKITWAVGIEREREYDMRNIIDKVTTGSK